MELFTTLSKSVCAVAGFWCSEPELEAYQLDPAPAPLYISAGAKEQLGWMADEITRLAGVPVMFLSAEDMPGYFQAGDGTRIFNFEACVSHFSPGRYSPDFIEQNADKNIINTGEVCKAVAYDTTGVALLIDKDENNVPDAGIMVIANPEESLRKTMSGLLASHDFDSSRLPFTNTDSLFGAILHETGHIAHRMETNGLISEALADRFLRKHWPDYVAPGKPISPAYLPFYEEWRHASSVGSLAVTQKDGVLIMPLRRNPVEMAEDHMTGYLLESDKPVTFETLVQDERLEAAIMANYMTVTFQADALFRLSELPENSGYDGLLPYWQGQAILRNTSNRPDAYAVQEVMTHKGWVEDPLMRDFVTRSRAFVETYAPGLFETDSYKRSLAFYNLTIPTRDAYKEILKERLNDITEDNKPMPRPD